jgi:sortase A
MRQATLAHPCGVLTGGRRRPSSARQLLRTLSSLLIGCGVLLLVDAVVTVVWQEPLTAVVGLLERNQIDRHFLSDRTAPLSAPDRRALRALPTLQQRIAYLARREQRGVRTGDAIGRLEIPSLGATFTVVQGTDATSLAKGPGHYPATSLPGMGQTVAIAGHRTTYLAPFRHLDALRSGDRIVLRMPYGRFVYAVQYHRIVAPTAWWIARGVGYDRLVLSACNPVFSASQRIVVFARLEYVRPLGAAESAAFAPGGAGSDRTRMSQLAGKAA